MKRTKLLMVLILALALSGCSSSASPSPEVVAPSQAVSNPAESTPAPPASGSLSTDYKNALSLPLQLALGTLRLEGTPQAVTPEQAKSLVVLWQAFAALSSSSASASQEFTAVENQITQAMAAEQLHAIAGMRLTSADMAAFFAEQGLAVPQPPPGITPGVTGQNLTQAQRDALRATMQASGAVGPGVGGSGKSGQSILVDKLVTLLTRRAGG